ncbi:stage II sporulation protein P [bacterium 1XD8-76]|nr:stage II sporulation protein P [bacterium 1XD8-76]
MAAFLLLVCPAGELVEKVYGQLFPTAAFCMDTLAYGERSVSVEGKMMDMLSRELPLYSYSISYFGDGMMNQYYREYVEILMQEAEEGTEEMPPEQGDQTGEGAGGSPENTGEPEDVPEGTEEEQGSFIIEEAEEEGGQRLNEEGSPFMITDGSTDAMDKDAYRELIHTEKAQSISLEDYREFEALVGKFYTVDASTYTTAEELSAIKLSSVDMKMAGSASGPQILIYHTHSHEGYADSAADDASTTIIGVGEHLAEILRQEYGYQVLHHTGVYDEDRDYAYSNALPALEQVLKENPTIEVVIDLHRDSVAADTRLVTEIGGQQTARFMFFNGLSRVRELGEIGYLPNENLQGNLAFSFQMQKTCEEYYPGLARKIYLKGYRYNMHLKPRTLLVELGAQNNTVQEAMNACGPLARVLDMVLSGE